MSLCVSIYDPSYVCGVCVGGGGEVGVSQCVCLFVTEQAECVS